MRMILICKRTSVGPLFIRVKSGI